MQSAEALMCEMIRVFMETKASDKSEHLATQLAQVHVSDQVFETSICQAASLLSLFDAFSCFITKQATSDAPWQFWRDFILLGTWHCMLQSVHVRGHSGWQVLNRWLLHTGLLIAVITAN